MQLFSDAEMLRALVFTCIERGKSRIGGRLEATAIKVAVIPWQQEPAGIKPTLRNTEADMTRHRFKVGQLVDFAPPRSGVPTAGRQYEIIRLLPVESGELLYRVKSKGEAFERVAKERELSRRDPV